MISSICTGFIFYFNVVISKSFNFIFKADFLSESEWALLARYVYTYVHMSSVHEMDSLREETVPVSGRSGA